MTLTPSQDLAFKALCGGQSLFLTGGAGTGKSHLIQTFLRSKPHSKKKTPVLASTGAAAILLGGRTFHSFFGLGILQGGPAAVFEKALANKRLKKRLQEVESLIVDEVSMLSGEAFDCAEKISRALRQNEEPWGGIRVVVVGDFFQLPPVGRTPQKDWAFRSQAWQSSQFQSLELKEFVRTEEADFLEVLNDVRVGECSDKVEEFFESRVSEYADSETPHLFSRRDVTERFNRSRLAEIDSDLKVLPTIYAGEPYAIEVLKREAPIPQELELKEGAFVMIRINDPRQRYVNGTTGSVRRIRDDMIEIETKDRLLEIEKFTFTSLNADGNIVGEAVNFPLSLAYASTIHKIQGATLPKAHIDLGAIWEPGQAYVAVSRVRRAADLSLQRWSAEAIKADSWVRQFYSRFQGQSDLCTASRGF